MAESPRRLKLPYFRISLEFIGEDWKECYAEFSEMSWAQRKQLYAKAMQIDPALGAAAKDAELDEAARLAKARAEDEKAEAELVAVVQQAFIKGTSLDADGKQVELEAADFTMENFTSDAMMQFYNRILGVVLPKEATTSPATTPEQDPSPLSTSSSDTESASVSQ